MLISEYSLLPTGAPSNPAIIFDIILSAPTYPALTSSGGVDEAAWCRQELRVSTGERRVNVQMGWAMGHADVGVTTHPLLHSWARGIGSLILGSLMLSESLYCCEHVQQLDCGCA